MTTEQDISEQAPVEVTGSDPPDQRAKRGRSTIAFPYQDLGAAEEIAAGISKYGVECQTSDLAGRLDTTVDSGAFRAKISAAQMFGLSTGSRAGVIRLTDLGRAINDESQVRAARAEAFLNVELYALIFREFAGGKLPEDDALERYMVSKGVVAKMAARARQAFQRSAEQAGYSEAGKDRLTRPPVDPFAAPADDGKPQDGADAGSRLIGMAANPVLKALWDTLPAERPFTAEARRRFFTTLAFNIDYVYGPAPDGDFDPAAMATLWKIKPNDPSTAPTGVSDEPPF